MSIEDVTMYNVRELATLLHCGEANVRTLIHKGKLRGFVHRGTMNRRFLMVTEADLKEYIYTTYLQTYSSGRKPRQSNVNKNSK